MKKSKIKENMKICLSNKMLCRVFLYYDINYRYYFPLKLNDKLFLGAEEDDFLLDGYAIRRIKDIRKTQIKDDFFYRKILENEGILDSIEVPDIDITNWETVFQSLQKRDKNIIVQKENLDEDKCDYVIGRIEKVYKNFVYVRHFDGDGIWQDAPFRIPYKEITSVTFGSRYVDIFSKYLSELPDNFHK